MMAGNPNWWSMMNGMHPQLSSQFANSPAAHLSSNPSPPPHHHHPNLQDNFPVRSTWSQLLLGGVQGGGEDHDEEEEERYDVGGAGGLFQQQKSKLENWEDQVLNLNPISSFARDDDDHVKQEEVQLTSYGHVDHELHHQPAPATATANRPNSNSSWPAPPHQQLVMPHVSSPTSCITNILNFSGPKSAPSSQRKNQHHDCNSTGTGGVSNKKARVQQSSAQPALKVRKEKLGDRITALHQLVSPFGKTDTASVLSEAIGYIRFLQGQIEALSSPYMRNSGSTGHHQHSFLNDFGMERGAPKQESEGRTGAVKDLRSRGLCLVPISCTQHVGNDNGADYWAPAALGGGF
ncbi:Transcription factor [Sesamum alatum]|uniref:Transcription factor n=1 Tax=Sesamum alatum TaxID=300844 RepID=A0AAE2CMY5_9LAMI|nr:Transcription factor [Sesamum alatum]